MFRFMKTPDRIAALRKARKTLKLRDQKIARMRNKLEELTSEKGIEVDSDVQDELESVIKEKRSYIESLPVTDFRRIFWEQQVIVKYICFK